LTISDSHSEKHVLLEMGAFAGIAGGVIGLVLNRLE